MRLGSSRSQAVRPRAAMRLVLLGTLAVLAVPVPPTRAEAFVKAPGAGAGSGVGPLQRLGAKFDALISRVASLADRILGRFSQETAEARRQILDAQIRAKESIAAAQVEARQQVSAARQALREAPTSAKKEALSRLERALQEAKDSVSSARLRSAGPIEAAKAELHEAMEKARVAD
mmetsp:Transcript_84821/g.189489  ORF Transcript_84821/g.189489 Transcript_84821/m.189489 type:complete len:176 (+) Transcript_84821:59-586(+)